MNIIKSFHTPKNCTTERILTSGCIISQVPLYFYSYGHHSEEMWDWKRIKGP